MAKKHTTKTTRDTTRVNESTPAKNRTPGRAHLAKITVHVYRDPKSGQFTLQSERRTATTRKIVVKASGKLARRSFDETTSSFGLALTNLAKR